MRWFHNLSAFAKLMGAFGLLGVLLAVVGWLAIDQLGTLQANADELYKHQLLPLVALSDIQDDVQRIRQHTYRMFATTDVKVIRDNVETSRELDRDLVERNKAYLALTTS